MNKLQLAQWIDARRERFDADENPFGCSAWLQHYLSQVGQEDWSYHADDASLLLCYATAQQPYALQALRNYYTCLLPARGAPQADFPGAWVNLSPLDEDLAALIAARLSEGRWYVRRYLAHANYYLPCEGLTFEKYLEGRSSQTINTLRRKGKKFQGRLEIVTGAAGEDLEKAIAAYEQVYLHSWKKPEPYPQFVPDWMRICASNGWLRLAVAWLDDTPIAAQFWIVRARRAYVYKLAYDERHKQWSAGTLLTAELMRRVLDVDRVIEVDYLSGNDAYKREWMTHRRQRVGLMCCNLRSARGVAQAAYELAGQLTQQFRARISASSQAAP